MDGRDAAFMGVATAFLDAYNQRDLDAWTALFHVDASYHPTLLSGTASLYVGRDAVRQFLEEVREDDRGVTARVTDVRSLSDDEFVARGEVMIEEQVVTPVTMIIRLRDGLIIEGRSILADAAALEQGGLIPPAN
jgi:ketosteroid isomerase-like protein